MQPKDYEELIIATYIGRILEAYEKSEKELLKRGVDPKTMNDIHFDIMAKEVKEHFENYSGIFWGRMARLGDQDAAEADYSAMYLKVRDLFGTANSTRLSVVFRKSGGRSGAFYVPQTGGFGITRDIFYGTVVGARDDLAIHEKFHQETQRKYGTGIVDLELYNEADATLRTLDKLSEIPGTKQLLRNYISLSQEFPQALIRKPSDGKVSNVKDYLCYVFAPAIMMEMREQGKGTEDFLGFFRQAYFGAENSEDYDSLRGAVVDALSGGKHFSVDSMIVRVTKKELGNYPNTDEEIVRAFRKAWDSISEEERDEKLLDAFERELDG